MTNKALFDCDSGSGPDGGDQGFEATPSGAHTFTLRSPGAGVRSWMLQVWDPTGADPGLPIELNPPRASAGADLLTLVGTTSGKAVFAATPSSGITTTMAANPGSYIVRSVVNGGVKTGPDGTTVPDPDAIWERLIYVPDANGNAPIVATETTQYSDEGWTERVNTAMGAYLGDGSAARIYPLTVGPSASGNAASGAQRVYHGFSLVGLNNAGTTDRTLLSWGIYANDTLEVGDGNSDVVLVGQDVILAASTSLVVANAGDGHQVQLLPGTGTSTTTDASLHSEEFTIPLPANSLSSVGFEIVAVTAAGDLYYRSVVQQYDRDGTGAPVALGSADKDSIKTIGSGSSMVSAYAEDGSAGVGIDITGIAATTIHWTLRYFVHSHEHAL